MPTCTHWIGMSGLTGCFMPDTCFSTDTKKAAAESFAGMFELSTSYILRKVREGGGHMDLDNQKHGAEYLSITPCECEEPHIHND
jgi:hypothetical protein